MAEDEWVSRKRKTLADSTDPASIAAADAQSRTQTTSATTSLPSSLIPHLGWTQLSACHIEKAKKKQKKKNLHLRLGKGRDVPEQLHKVVGKAIFFVHDPNPDIGDNQDDSGEVGDDDSSSDGDDENTTWFQGRFFPRLGIASPVSVTTTSPIVKSWGLLAQQKLVVDECLRCEEGGYRELDLTLIRHVASPFTGKKKTVRWVAEDLQWTGGDMMRLATDSMMSSLREDQTGCKFEPATLMGGKKAMDVATKYFPSLVRQLTDGNDDIDLSDALVVIGDMEVVAPASFVSKGKRNSPIASNASDDDGLWND